MNCTQKFRAWKLVIVEYNLNNHHIILQQVGAVSNTIEMLLCNKIQIF